MHRLETHELMRAARRAQARELDRWLRALGRWLVRRLAELWKSFSSLGKAFIVQREQLPRVSRS